MVHINPTNKSPAQTTRWIFSVNYILLLLSTLPGKQTVADFIFSMASSSKESAAKANILGKRKQEDDSETKPILILKKLKELSEEKETTIEQIEGSVELLETKSDQANFISVKETVEGFDEAPDFVEEPKKTLFVSNLSLRQTHVSDIIDFFKDVGQVVRVRLMLSRRSKPVGHAFVEFVSANEAKKALETKNGQYLHDRKIILDVANKANNGAPYLPPKYEDSQPERLRKEEDETPSESDCAEEVVLFVANLSPQTTEISDITDFFGDVAEVVSVRLIANREGKHLGYGFVEFASADEAKRALEKMNGEYLHDHKILLMKGLGKAPGFAEAVAAREKTLFAAHLSSEAEISDIINFFKDAGEVVHVRLLVSHKGKRVGYGFVEFASFNEANKALEKKNGEYLHDRKIILGAVSTASCHPPKFEDYLRLEGLVIEEDAAVESPDFAEEVAARNKTLFVANLSGNVRIANIIGFFKGVGEVVGVRLIVDHRGESVGCGFVEFASANEAKKALQEKKDSKIILNVAEIAPYPFRLKYNLVKKLWYEDNILRRESLGLVLETKPNPKVTLSGKKITFSYDDDE